MINFLETSVLVPQRKNTLDVRKINLTKVNKTLAKETVPCVWFSVIKWQVCLIDLQVQGSPSEDTSIRGQ